MAALDTSIASSSAVQVVSQTLPCPGPARARPNALYNEVISGIQSRYGPDRHPYITITHAVPPRFDLLELPRSPPSTPNIVLGRGDYFAQSIFANAAVVPAYHSNNLHLTASAPPSPNPIVPPSSTQISVLERYLPPPSLQEDRELFSLSGQSMLVDRLSELSPNEGRLLFVYPTRSGANRFISTCLNPVIEPLLRALVNVHELSYGLAESLSTMVAVAGMHEFENLTDKVSSLCRLMSHRVNSDPSPSTFRLLRARRAHVPLDGRTWTDWYLRQEHHRFKRTLERYWGRGQRLSQLDSATAGTVLREFIDGVKKATCDDLDRLSPDLEVGVFVIHRTPTIASVQPG